MKNDLQAKHVLAGLQSVATTARAKSSAWYFKTAKGEYGEGDVFIGVTVPAQRKISHKFQDLPLKEVAKLLASEIHECRLVALFILVQQYEKGDEKICSVIYNFYLSYKDRINNWDLVDSSAPRIMGAYMMKHPENKPLLYAFALSKSLWERRIAILSTFTFIKHEDYADALALAELMLGDREDLIHKATGWMLREIGKKSRDVEEQFLARHFKQMPRTMLRYAIEKFPQKLRQTYLSK